MKLASWTKAMMIRYISIPTVYLKLFWLKTWQPK